MRIRLNAQVVMWETREKSKLTILAKTARMGHRRIHKRRATQRKMSENVPSVRTWGCEWERGSQPDRIHIEEDDFIVGGHGRRL